jgi:hypothetical protein
VWRLTLLLAREDSADFTPRLLGQFVPALTAAVGGDARLLRLVANIRPADLDPVVGDWLARVRAVPLCADMGFARASDFLATYGSADYLRVIRPDEERFSRPGEMLAFVSGEERELLEHLPLHG